jgi:hypothetical protein
MFDSLSLAGNLSVFAAAAAIVWLAGTRIARYADAIAEKTGMGRELLGIVSPRPPRSPATRRSRSTISSAARRSTW